MVEHHYTLTRALIHMHVIKSVITLLSLVPSSKQAGMMDAHICDNISNSVIMPNIAPSSEGQSTSAIRLNLWATHGYSLEGYSVYHLFEIRVFRSRSFKGLLLLHYLWFVCDNTLKKNIQLEHSPKIPFHTKCTTSHNIRLASNIVYLILILCLHSQFHLAPTKYSGRPSKTVVLHASASHNQLTKHPALPVDPLTTRYHHNGA